MEQDITFNKLITKLEEFQKRHPQLNSFGFGNLIEFGSDIENTAPLYPLMFVVPQAITYEEPLTQYSLQIFFADRLNNDNDGSISVVSSMSQIARDLLGILKLNEDFRYLGDYDFPVTAAPFLERFNDVLAGVSMTLNMNVSDYLDICQLNPLMNNYIHITGEFFNTNGENVFIRVRNVTDDETTYEHPMTGSTSVDVKVPVDNGKDYQIVLINYREAMSYEWFVGEELLETNDCQPFKTFSIFDLQNSYSLNITMDPLCPPLLISQAFLSNPLNNPYPLSATTSPGDFTITYNSIYTYNIDECITNINPCDNLYTCDVNYIEYPTPTRTYRFDFTIPADWEYIPTLYGNAGSHIWDRIDVEITGNAVLGYFPANYKLYYNGVLQGTATNGNVREITAGTGFICSNQTIDFDLGLLINASPINN